MPVMIGPPNTLERVQNMSRHFTSAFAIAALLGSFIIVDTAEAAKSRSSIDRRQRPGKGYFAPKGNTNRSYSSSRPMFRSAPRYSAPRYVAPRTYTPAPTYTAPVIRSAPVMQPTAPVVQQSYTQPSNVVSTPRVFYNTQPRIISDRVIAIDGVPVDSQSQPAVTTQPGGTIFRR
tara:strand:+ start:33451 stop:33975 length:525 start_codon:yes stop_codon:yes gene_type:complete